MLREREKTRPAARRSPAAARERRSALACAGCSLLLACVWASLWWNALVYPITVEQAAGWRARSPAAAAALRAAPRSARSVELVVSRFSGNLSWVPALAAQMRVTNITVYCKVRVGWRAGAAATHRRRARIRMRPRRRCRARTRCPTLATRATPTCGT